ncbi:MAG: 23S rRNA (pseudouridine(1915)-N(3))-methyltransferase RlmH [Clostridiales bacterium]|jgi:23S rRNA (pseudouridine1915-N3)-methyltransferase|nr:23S rRNA (pseudouridine(1915)-N(3))-methyltransferase RlmH [Clostridiales bacterium]
MGTVKINIVSVGGLKEKYLAEALKEYEKRLTAFCEICFMETPECNDKNGADEVKNAEGRLILGRLEKLKGYTIALDDGGETPDSIGFSEIIGAASERGAVNFVVGGSHGLSRSVLDKADKIISFGKMTFPHQLFRVILIEQIYRAFMIRANRSYHK